VIAVAFDAKAHNGLSSRRNSINDALGPAILNADHHHRGNIWVAAGANQCLKVEIQVRAKLKASVRMGDRHGALDGHCNGLCGSIGEIIERQDDDVIADTDTLVIAAIAPERSIF